ncbi:TetR family transcriptional regulator [Candidatus Pantoea deserta]|uniref:TetR family transcriptional regulator n=1 Tax=Candidatus Pantoea deserta TaxID=1869313 RepID=A0A3N4PE63_9GAMM|nr:TetR family transcriptional regulator [Pantoea deserta]RPE02837.1 TetR family transcriptional regulator [Pantoea deserta]
MVVSRDIKSDILDATLTVIVSEGVRGTTYRRVADRAGLSPGTLTYHFPQTDLLLMAAFSHMVDAIAQAFRQRMQRAADRDAACEAVVDLICGDVWASQRHLILSFELYSLAARKEPFRQLLQQWMSRSRESLHLFFPMETACALDALIEGFTIHNLLNDTPISRDAILRAVRNIAGQPE